MVEEIRLMLGAAEGKYSDALIELHLNQSKVEVEAYCGRKLDEELELVVKRITVIKLNRTNSEGLASQSYSGVSESYIDGYPADILSILNRKRKVKLI